MIADLKLGSPEFKRDPYPALTACLAQPVMQFRMPIVGKSWLATQYAAANEVLKNTDAFSRSSTAAGKRALPGVTWWMPRSLTALTRNMLGTEGADHRRLRKLVDAAFQRAQVDSLKPAMESLCQQYLAQIRQLSVQGPVNFVEAFAQPLPLAVICEMLGIPDSDRPQFSTWFSRFSSVRSVWSLMGAMGGLRKAVNYIRGQIKDCQANPRRGLISDLVQLELEGDRLSEDELLAMIFLLLVAGHETTVHLISGMLWVLLQHPTQRQQLVDDWSLLDSAVHETLRYYCPVQITKPRWVIQDQDFHGVALKRGQLITACLATANLDPREFEQPLDYRIDRQPNRHIAFGTGPHVCLGLKLAVAEAGLAIRTMLEQTPDLQIEGSVRWSKRLGVRSLQELPIRI